jgi:hypothetical protein
MRNPKLILLAVACLTPPALAQGAYALRTPIDDFSPTILDCSPWIEAPTGKHGFLQRRGEDLVFEDGKAARFWGAQISLFAKDQIDYTARRMRKQGINLVRLAALYFLNPRNAASILDYDRSAFDQLDYLIATLGRNGIYLILDTDYPLTVRFGPKDGIAGLEEGGPAPFAEFFNPRVAQLKQQRMRDVFTHLNPYTKKRYADDPTLALVEIENEDSLFWYSENMREPFKTELRTAFQKWLAKRYGSSASGELPELIPISSFRESYFAKNPQQRQRAADELRFYLELENKYWSESRKVLRDAGVRVPITGTNWQGGGFTTRVHMLGQSGQDYIDRHGYWDHPQGVGNARWRISTSRFLNLPMLKSLVTGNDPQEENNAGNLVVAKAWQRVFGMPMTISEWNTCRPNEYSLEGTGVMAAYGLLQGWNGLLEFAYSSPDWPAKPNESSFDLLENPPQILQFPAAATMWYRQDVDAGPVVGELAFTPESVFDLVSDRLPVPVAAALVGKVGYRFSSSVGKPVALDVSKYWDERQRVVHSATGQLTWDAGNGRVQVNTPRTQAVIGFLSVEPNELESVRLQTGAKFGAVYVTAMDGSAPIRSARRLLVTAVGAARNTGMEYEQTAEVSAKFKAPLWRTKTVGTFPVLMDGIEGELQISSEHASEMKAWPLDVNGKRGPEIPLSRSQNAIIITMKASYEAACYEVAVK